MRVRLREVTWPMRTLSLLILVDRMTMSEAEIPRLSRFKKGSIEQNRVKRFDSLQASIPLVLRARSAERSDRESQRTPSQSPARQTR